MYDIIIENQKGDVKVKESRFFSGFLVINWEQVILGIFLNCMERINIWTGNQT